ncbi:DUF4376 domain-containing protein [Variovorax sp. EL159]|uniref:DUF4376 domain-containing protein n=1 Tax=Variovorax sp. EL159 TaxID=1566270 RepID=UPI000880C7E0|nr:DUF4376 domain-containing protein [Variovorax sp. EL159]SCX70914.1 protein of unknown function [Variovorax sp. EL159]
MYKILGDLIVRLADDARIPHDPCNVDYVAYRDWLAAGNTPQVPSGPSQSERRSLLRNAATARRWQAETGGITLPDGTRIKTDRDDQNNVANALAIVGSTALQRIDFKAATGWVSITPSELQAIAAAVGLHKQSCFSVERAHHEAIDALTDDGLDGYDVTTGWP